MMQTYQLNNLLFILKITTLLFFVQSTLIASNIVDDTYLYDVSMFQKEGDNILPCPEIIIRFNELGEDFKPGDKIYIKLETKTEKTQPLLWYYPSAHEKNVSFFNRLLRKTKNIKSVLAGINYRVKKFKVSRKTIPYPSFRFMSDDILGNARGKVAPKLLFNKTRNTIRIDIENKMSGVDILRIKGLYLSSKNGEEAGPSILLYKKNKNEKWKRLGNQKFIFGKSLINDINPKRFIRMLDNRHTFSLNIEIGQNPTIKKNEKLIIKLSDDFQASWSLIDKHILIVKEGRKEIQYNVTPEVSDRNIIFPINFNIPKKSQLILPKLEITSSTGEIDQLSKGFITILTELTGNFDHKTLKKETILGGISDSLLFMYPRIKIREQDLMFYLSPEKDPVVSIEIYTEKGSYFEKGDIIKIKIPHGVNVDWGKIPPQKENKGIQVKRIGNKLIEVQISQTINKSILLDKITFNKPAHSIPPFELVSSFSFAPDTLLLTVEGEISFGQSNIVMANPKLINRLQKEAYLNDIIITEDNIITTLKTGDIVEIIGNNDFFHFNINRLSEIKISDKEGSNNRKIGIDFEKSSTDRIILNIRENLDIGEEIYISNIPLTEIKKIGRISLKYNLNNKSILAEENEIKIIELSLELAEKLEFIRDINNINKSFSVDGLYVHLEGVGKIFNQGERLVLTLPEKTGKWIKLNEAKLISSAEEFRINKDNSRYLIITTKKNISNEANLTINNLFLQPTVNEFIDIRLTLTAETDSTVSDKTVNSITFSYPSLRSLDDQVFFNDDTSWYLYNVNLSTRNLKNSINPDSKISLLINDKNVEWDTKYKHVKITGDDAEKLNTLVEFDGKSCSLIASEKIGSDMFFEISGLRIKPILNPDIEFSLQLSFDDGNTICAKDLRSKSVKPITDYSGKRERSIEESKFAMDSGKSWQLTIPDSLDYQWDTNRNQIKQVFIRKGIKKGGINIKSLSDKVKYINEKTVKIDVINGYGTINQGLELSGASTKKMFFSGLLVNHISGIKQSVNKDYLNLTIKTPYGTRSIHSHESGAPDWGITINGQKYFSMSQLAGTELEVGISTPQVKEFGKQGILDVSRLNLYINEKILLFNPLIKNIRNTKEDKAKKDILATLEHIKKFYDDTDPKGMDWKVWYYLAYAKWNANELGILEELLINSWLRDDRALTKGSYDDDMKKAIDQKRGYQPHGRHEDYPLIEKGNLLAEINANIKKAKDKFLKKDLIEAEEDFLIIMGDINKYDEISHRLAVVDYWLGRIALDLDDIEYDNYKESYPYRKFYKASRIYKENNKSLYSSEPWLEDSIRVYKDLAKNIVKNRNDETNSFGVSPQRGKKGSISLGGVENAYRFRYKYDNNYKYRILGESGSPIGLVNIEKPDKILVQGEEIFPGFDDEIRLGKGGEYKIKFSPKNQSFYNLFFSIIIIGLLGFVYG